ncbi:MAG: hypothetical protein JO360_10755 [Acidobacteria bacterium]|nr:hypothetical protein [Acidobacteriota bacterium]
MKRKGITIFLFSMMALAATPRAAQHFRIFVAAAQNQAQVELLQLLLNIGAPAEESQAVVPQQAEPAPAAACNAPAANSAQVANVRPRTPAQPSARNRAFEFAFAKTLPAEFVAVPAAPVLNSLQAEAVARRQVFVKVNSEMDAVAPYLDNKTASVKALLRGVRLDEKTSCELEKELAALVKGNRRAVPVARLKAVKIPLDAPAAKGGQPVEWEFTDR